MNKEDADCTALISGTAEALDNEVLETLLVSAQQVNLEICVDYAVRRKVIGECLHWSFADKFHLRTLQKMLESPGIHEELQRESGWRLQTKVAAWFPHTYVSIKNAKCMMSIAHEIPFLVC